MRNIVAEVGVCLAFAGLSCGGGGSADPAGGALQRGVYGQYFFVNVTRPTNGTIASSDGRIDCGASGATCGDTQGQTRYQWAQGPVTLTATPAAGFAFQGWTGDCAGVGSCALDTAVNRADRIVGATFQVASTVAGPELPIPGSTPLNQDVPSYSVAPCGENFLVVWGTTTGVYGARVSRAGELVDRTPLAFSATGQGPSVASNGTSCLVAWGQPDGIFAVRLGLDGVLLDAAPIAIQLPGISFADPWTEPSFPRTSTASNGRDYFVAAEVLVSGNLALLGGGISGEGVALQDPGSSIALEGCLGDGYGPSWTFTAASTGTGFLLAFQLPFDCSFGEAWDVSKELHAQSVGTATQILLNPSSGRQNAVASDGTDAVVVWSSDWPQGWYLDVPPNGMKVVRVTAAGALLDAEPILVSSSSSPPAVQYDGSDYLIVWFEPSSGPTQALAARFGRDGRFAAASADLLFSGPGLGVPVLASDGAGSSLLVYSVTDATGAGSLRARTLGAH